MANPWDPERIVSAERAQSLIESQFPGLKPARIEPLGAGWDNTAFLVSRELVFRFPRRQIAVPLIDTEARLLPMLAPRLPLPIPVPNWIGHSEARYPWPFAGYRNLAGRPAYGMDGQVRAQMARPLAEFLRALHATPMTEARRWGAGPDVLRRLDVSRLGPMISRSLDDLAARRVIDDPQPWLDIIDSVSSISTVGHVALVHGDLCAGHLLVENDGQLSGIIDWGDLHCGNPANDLSIGWSFFPPAARDAFFTTYGSIDRSVLSLARLRALFLATVLETYGRDRRDADVVSEGLRALRFVVMA